MSISTNRTTAYARNHTAIYFSWRWHPEDPRFRQVWRSDWNPGDYRLVSEDQFERMIEFGRLWDLPMVERS